MNNSQNKKNKEGEVHHKPIEENVKNIELVMVPYEYTDKQAQIMEGVLPIKLEVYNMREMVNRNNTDLDEENMMDNIRGATVAGDLSP